MEQTGEHKGVAVIRKIGLTGGIASGKSAVAEILCRLLHCIHIDADEVCRRLLEPKAEGWQEFSRAFGAKYLTADGNINRPILRQDLFADKDFRRKVNNVIHPLVKKTIRMRINDTIKVSADSKVLVEVPLLFEVHWENLFDTVVVVYADYEVCLNRLMARDGLVRATAVNEMESQMPLVEKVMKADHVIDNSGTLVETENQVEHLAALLRGSSRRGYAVEVQK